MSQPNFANLWPILASIGQARLKIGQACPGFSDFDSKSASWSRIGFLLAEVGCIIRRCQCVYCSLPRLDLFDVASNECPLRLTNITAALYRGLVAGVYYNGILVTAIDLQSGIRQGCAVFVFALGPFLSWYLARRVSQRTNFFLYAGDFPDACYPFRSTSP